MDLKEMVPNLPAGMTNVEEVLLQTAEIPWREKSLKGLYEKMLWRAENDQGSIALIKFEKGIGIPAPHSHDSNQFMFVLEGHSDRKFRRVPMSAAISSTRRRTSTAPRECSRRTFIFV